MAIKQTEAHTWRAATQWNTAVKSAEERDGRTKGVMQTQRWFLGETSPIFLSVSLSVCPSVCLSNDLQFGIDGFDGAPMTAHIPMATPDDGGGGCDPALDTVTKRAKVPSTCSLASGGMSASAYDL